MGQASGTSAVRVPEVPSSGLAALIVAARGGDAHAQEALYRQFAPQSFALAARLLGERDLAWDAVHNAFILVFGKLRQLREPEAFSGWLRTTVVRETLRLRRRQRRATPLPSIDVDALANDEATGEERADFARCHHLLAKVREPDRTIFLLRKIAVYELTEVATLVGLSLATVKRKISRVEAHFRSLGEGDAR